MWKKCVSADSELIGCGRGQLHRLQAAVAPIFNLEPLAIVPYEEIVDVFLGCVESVCGGVLTQAQSLLRPAAVASMAALLLQECEDMCAASAPLTMETASVLCTRIGLLRGRLLLGQREGGTCALCSCSGFL